jgi:hypothetical protein
VQDRHDLAFPPGQIERRELVHGHGRKKSLSANIFAIWDGVNPLVMTL